MMREKVIFLVLFTVLSISSVAVIIVNAPEISQVHVNPLSPASSEYSYLYPIQNMNFTDMEHVNQTWVTSVIVTSGTARYGNHSKVGNPLPGSREPGYYQRANSTASQTANIIFVTEQSFQYSGELPYTLYKPVLSYAYNVSGNSIGSSTLSVTLVKPDFSTLTYSVSYAAATPWTYKTGIIIEPGNFTQTGTYKLQLKSVSTTSAVGTGNYIQVNWDDVGLRFVTRVYVDPPSIIDLSKGTGNYFSVDARVANVMELWSYEFYIKWDPTLLEYLSRTVRPIQNPNFTDTASTVWVTSTTVTSGTPTYGYDTTTWNSALPSYFHRADSTAIQTANITFVTEQSFDYRSGLPVGVVDFEPRLSYAYAISGNSIGSSTLSVTLVKPDSSTQLLHSVTRTAETSWTYNTGIIIEPKNFTQAGIYKLRFKSVSTTSAAGAGNYIKVNWDDVGLKIYTNSIAQGDFLMRGGDTYFTYIDNQTAGWIYVTSTLEGQPYVTAFPVTGSGTLAAFTFRVKKLGSTIFDIYNSILRDPWLSERSHPVQDGYFSNKMPGDANGDKIINSADLYIVGVAYGTKYGEAKYDVRADFNGDESIDNKDISLLAGNYGKTY